MKNHVLLLDKTLFQSNKNHHSIRNPAGKLLKLPLNRCQNQASRNKAVSSIIGDQ